MLTFCRVGTYYHIWVILTRSKVLKIEHKPFLGHLWLRLRWRGMPFVLPVFLILTFFLISCEATPTSNSVLSARDDTVRVEPDTSPNARNITIDPLLPPGGSDRPAKAGQLGRPHTEAGIPVLDSKGPNLEHLFAQPEKNTDARIKRLENAVVEIRNDLDAALPAINRLLSIEGDIQQLVGQLQTLLNDEGIGTDAPKIQALRPPARPTETDTLIDELNDGSGGTKIEPLNPEYLVRPVPPEMPKIAPQEIERKVLQPLVPQVSKDQVPQAQTNAAVSTTGDEKPEQGEIGIRVDPLPREEKQTPVASVEPVREKQIAPEKTEKHVTEKPSAKRPIKTIAPSVVPKPETEKNVVPAAPVKMNFSSVRLGDHGDKVRVVIESTQPIKISQDLDNTEKILVIDVKGADMETLRQDVANNPLVAAMSMTGDKKGASGQIALELKKETRVEMTTVMPPQGDKKVYRAVVDLAR